MSTERIVVERSLEEVNGKIADLNQKLTKAGRSTLNADESRKYNKWREERATLEGRLMEIESNENRAAIDAAARARFGVDVDGQIRTGFGLDGVQSESLVYNVRNRQGASWFMDVERVRQFGDREARERLERAHKQSRDFNKRAGLVSNVNGQGAEFDPPGWYISDFIKLARPGRVTANVCASRTLPKGVSSINLPKVATGTTTAIQGTQGTAISNTDPTTTSITSGVSTFAGFNLVSQQFIDQSPVNTDEIVLQDLAADLAKQIDLQVIGGTGSSGQLLGILSVTSPNTVQYTSASPTVGGAGQLYAQIMKAVGLVATNRFAPADAIIMTPNRWAWIASVSDTQNRPLVVPTGTEAGGAINAMGTNSGVANGISDGLVGHIAGLPVYADANIGTTYNTNQDAILVARFSDLWLYEQPPNLEVFSAPYANSMQVLVRAYSYAAFLPHRYPKSITLIGGLAANTSTGLVYPPTF